MFRVRVSKSAAAVIKYFRDGLKRDNYYFKGQEVPAQWLGTGSEKLGLKGEVKEDDFISLVNNRDPNNSGKRLTPRDKGNRRPGYEGVLSAWKSASVMDALYGCSDIRQAFWEAGDEMMTQKAEPEMHTRVRKGGRDYDRVTANMICSAFRDLRSRPVKGRSDMHLHTHYYVQNITWDPVEMRWKAAQLGGVKEKAPDLELDADARFAKKLRALGYVPVMGKKGLQLAGVPQSVIDKFSQRRNQIDKESAEQGVTDPEGKHRIGAAIRESKKNDLPADKLMADWKSRLTPEEEAALERVRDKKIAPGREISARESVDFAVGHLFQREDVVPERKLRKTAVQYGIGCVMPDEVDREITGALERGEILKKQGKKGLQFVKATTLRDQVRMTHLAREGRGQYEPFTTAYENLPELSAEQNAVARAVAESRDKYMGVRGPAGTGKSYSLKGIDATIKARAANGEETFTRALALAPSSSASRGELRKAGFKDATTLAAFFESQKMQQEMQGQLLIVDESGMMSTRDMTQLMGITEKNNMRVLFLGDYQQHTSVDAGDAFRLLQSEGGIKYAQLTENRRQKDDDYRIAVDLIGSGSAHNAEKGMKILDKKGWIVEMPDAAARQNFLVGKFLQAADEGASALIVGTTNREGEQITERLREELKTRGKITGGERVFPSRLATNWTEAQKRDSRNYEPGMVVEFHKATPGVRKSVKGKRDTEGGFKQGETAIVLQGGDSVVLGRLDGTCSPLPAELAERFQVYRSGEQSNAKGDQIRITKNGMVKVKGQAVGTRVNNGDIFPVEGYTKEGDIRLPGGKLLPKDYGHFTLGYTDTSHRSQSKTVDRVFIAVDEHAPKATNRTQWYVSYSRGRELGLAVVADKKSAVEAVQRGGERLSALELMKDDIGTEKVTKQPRFGLQKMLEKNRIARYLKGRADALRESARALVQGWKKKEGMQYA
jgi:conjugative relaxase-like TrwC/TraI family protein